MRLKDDGLRFLIMIRTECWLESVTGIVCHDIDFLTSEVPHFFLEITVPTPRVVFTNSDPVVQNKTFSYMLEKLEC